MDIEQAKWDCICRLLSAHAIGSDLIAQEIEFIVDRLIKELTNNKQV